MYCTNCGAALPDNTRFCTNCGIQIGPAPDTNPAPDPRPIPPASFVADTRPVAGGGRVGYSERIHDPAFARYLKNTNRWSAVFSMILAVAAVIGFYIYGEISNEMENPQALFIGLGIGGMFLLIGLYTIAARKRSKTWDGVVVDKAVKKKSRHQSTGSDGDDYYIRYYTEYAVVIRDERGKKHRLAVEDDDTQYNYYQIGDRVRHHAGLNSYEKYDKSRDSIIFCSACATLCQIGDDVCWRCKCPLLK